MAPNPGGRLDGGGPAGGGRAVRTDPLALLSAARVTVVAGKGGVGKTTVTAVLAHAAAAAGRRVAVIEFDGKPALAELSGDVTCLELSAPAALAEYLRDHGFGRVARHLASSGVIDVVSTAAPGIDDIVVLGKVKQLERSGEWDTIVVDGPAAGHAVTMLSSAAGLHAAVSSGPVRAQADEVLAMLRDDGRCQVALVTLAETTPVTETIETAFALEDRVGVRLAPVVVNAVDDLAGALDDADLAAAEALGADVAAAAAFARERARLQTNAIERLTAELALPQLHVPRAEVGRLDRDGVAALTGRLLAA